jgi:nitrite reductase/ring-hydroxylating ferredoxin subunit
MAEYVTVGRADEVAEGEANGFVVNGEEIAVARVGGTLYAFSDVCTHRQCTLSMGGELDGTAITCECHGSEFDITSGEVLDGPATEPLAVFPVRDESGDLQVEA